MYILQVSEGNILDKSGTVKESVFVKWYSTFVTHRIITLHYLY